MLVIICYRCLRSIKRFHSILASEETRKLNRHILFECVLAKIITARRYACPSVTLVDCIRRTSCSAR